MKDAGALAEKAGVFQSVKRKELFVFMTDDSTGDPVGQFTFQGTAERLFGRAKGFVLKGKTTDEWHPYGGAITKPYPRLRVHDRRELVLAAQPSGSGDRGKAVYRDHHDRRYAGSETHHR